MSLFYTTYVTSADLDVSLVDFVKLLHALGGLYVWELLCGLWFDVRLLQRQHRGLLLLTKWVRCPMCGLWYTVSLTPQA